MDRMVHRFEAGGIKMALDVNSGALHIIDALIWDILDYGERFGWDQVVSGLSDRYIVSELEEGLCEIRQLTEKGMMYSEWEEQPVQQVDPVIKAICLFASEACNLNCRYCFVFEGESRLQGTLLTLDTGKKALDFLVARSGNRKNLEVDFFGGEPLLNIDVIKRVVEYGRSLEKTAGKEFKFTITTNGLLLNDDILGYINSEFANVVVSIDGRPKVHDRMRKLPDGSGSYHIILENAAKLADSRKQTGYFVRGTFSRYNLDFDKDVLHLADRGFKQVSVEPVVTARQEDYRIEEDDLPKVFDAYERLCKEYLARRSNGHRFNFFHFQVDLDQGPCVSKRVTGCGAGNEYVAITTEGDIYPCHQFAGDPDYKMGNITAGVFRDEIQNIFRHNDIFAKEECLKCWAKFYCGGGCPANSYHFSKDISRPYDIGCKMEMKRLECALMINAVEKIEQADDATQKP